MGASQTHVPYPLRGPPAGCYLRHAQHLHLRQVQVCSLALRLRSGCFANARLGKHRGLMSAICPILAGSSVGQTTNTKRMGRFSPLRDGPGLGSPGQRARDIFQCLERFFNRGLNLVHEWLAQRSAGGEYWRQRWGLAMIVPMVRQAFTFANIIEQIV